MEDFLNLKQLLVGAKLESISNDDKNLKLVINTKDEDKSIQFEDEDITKKVLLIFRNTSNVFVDMELKNKEVLIANIDYDELNGYELILNFFEENLKYDESSISFHAKDYQIFNL